MAVGSQDRLRICLVNRYGACNLVPTGMAARGLADALHAHAPHLHVELVHGPPRRGRAGSGAGLLRLAGALGWSIVLAWRAWRRGDVVISLTDPPFLPLFVALLNIRRRPWVLWSMDVYPQLFVASGVVSERHAAYQGLLRLAGRLRPALHLCLTEGQAQVQCSAGEPFLVLPVGLTERAATTAQDAKAPAEIVYAGTLGIVHDLEPLVRLVQVARDLPIRFVFAVRGQKGPDLRRRLSGAANVVWEDWLSDGRLRTAVAHLVSLSAGAANLCVPSKAVTSLCHGRPVIWIGPADGTWQVLEASSWRVPVERPYCDDELLNLLQQVLDPAEQQWRSAAAVKTAARLRHQWKIGVQTLARWLEGHGLPIALGHSDADGDTPAGGRRSQDPVS